MKPTIISLKGILLLLTIIFISFSSCKNKPPKTNSVEKKEALTPKNATNVAPPKVVKQPIEKPKEEKIVEPTYQGTATYYNDKYHGKKTASGEVYDKELYTAAIRMNALPFQFGTIVEVYSEKRKKKVIVKINDKMSNKASAIIDLSRQAAEAIGLDIDGRTSVIVREVYINTEEDVSEEE